MEQPRKSLRMSGVISEWKGGPSGQSRAMLNGGGEKETRLWKREDEILLVLVSPVPAQRLALGKYSEILSCSMNE